MSNENLDKTKTSGGQAGSKAGELNDADLESVAAGIIGVAGRRAPVPEDGRGIAGVPIPNDGRGLPIPEDGRGITGQPIPNDGKLSR